MSEKTNALTLTQSLLIVVAATIGLFALGNYRPLPETAPSPLGGVYAYFGPEGETVPVAEADRRIIEVAEGALEGSDYFGAFAVGPGGQTGAWTGAHSLKLARRYALAACGAGCEVVAERVPLYRDPSRSEQVLTTAVARNLAVKGPFQRDIITFGGASAWGHRKVVTSRGARSRAMRDAAADCEVRRAAEVAPAADISPPCRVQSIREILDLRPKPALYPAGFTVQLMDLVAAPETQIDRVPGTPGGGIIGPYLPPYLYGARAANGASSFEVVRGAGWPEAGDKIALEKCNAERRPGEEPCVVSHRRSPDPGVPEGFLAVTPTVYAGFVEWQQTQGAGAFAISPFGAWGSSFDHTETDTAIQKAADWCWYHTRKNWEYRQVDGAFLDAELVCRIVAIREP